MSETKSMLQEESALRWGFLEQEKDACAVVSDRMELVYMNEPARRLVPLDWFGRRCFEVFPTANDLCAIGCLTRTAVHEAHEILYCEEVCSRAMARRGSWELPSCRWKGPVTMKRGRYSS